MKYRTNYVCPKCEMEPLYLNLNKLPKELLSGSFSGLNITKEMLIESLRKNERSISEEIIKKSRLADNYNSLYCISCEQEFSFGKIVNTHL